VQSFLSVVRFCSILGVSVILVLLFKPRIDSKRHLQIRLSGLDDQIAQKQLKIEQLRFEEESLRCDPEYVERLARDRLNMARPDEYVIRFEEQKKKAMP